MRKIPLKELQRFVRETVIKSLIERIQGKDMPAGSSWHVAGNGWAGKNRHGVIDYFYGPDASKNKARADEFSKDASKKPEPAPGGVTRPGQNRDIRGATKEDFDSEYSKHSAAATDTANKTRQGITKLYADRIKDKSMTAGDAADRILNRKKTEKDNASTK